MFHFSELKYPYAANPADPKSANVVRIISFKLLRLLRPACHRKTRSSGRPDAAASDRRTSGSDLRSASQLPARPDVCDDAAWKLFS
jgi:hypothetical protein